MSMEQVPVSVPYVGAKKTTSQHPLGPLTAAEITESARLVRGLWPSNTELQFKVITLQEPNKADLIPFLAAERAGKQAPAIERRSFVVYYIRNTVSPCTRGTLRPSRLTRQDKLHEAVVSLSQAKIESNVRLGPNVHSNADGEEILAIERSALEDEGVKAEIAKLKLPEGTVIICDPWIYGMLCISHAHHILTGQRL